VTATGASRVVVLHVADGADADVARELASTGAAVVLVGTDADVLGATAAAIHSAGGRAAVFLESLRDPAARAALVEMVEELFAGL
jgi:NADP-dependent 3-hydroxy acid dehydrogenase YdfG